MATQDSRAPYRAPSLIPAKAGGRIRRARVGDQVVTLRHLRLWMAAVPQWAGYEGSDRWWNYVRNFRVPHKIAAQLEAGTFYATVLHGLSSQGTLDPKTLRFIRQAAGGIR